MTETPRSSMSLSSKSMIVLGRSQDRDEAEGLEDEAARFPPVLDESLLGQRGDFAAVDLDAAGARPVEAADHVQERRLAGAGAAVDDAELARRKRERHITQGVHGHGSRAVLLRDRLEPDERLSRHRRPAV